MDYLWIIWVAVGLLTILVETLTLGFAVICFSVGAFAAAVVAYFGAGVGWQLALFSLVSVISLVSVRPIAVRYFSSSKFSSAATNVNALIGRRAIVTQQIEGGAGRVRIDGDDWMVEIDDLGAFIPVGTKVEVVGVESVVLNVREIKL